MNRTEHGVAVRVLEQQPRKPLVVLLVLGGVFNIILQPTHRRRVRSGCRRCSGCRSRRPNEYHVHFRVHLVQDDPFPLGLVGVDPLRLILAVKQPHGGHRCGVDPQPSRQRGDKLVVPSSD